MPVSTGDGDVAIGKPGCQGYWEGGIQDGAGSGNGITCDPGQGKDGGDAIGTVAFDMGFALAVGG